MSKQTQIRALEERVAKLERALRALAEAGDENMANARKDIARLEDRLDYPEQVKAPLVWTP